MDPAAIIRVSGRHSSKTKEALALEMPDPRMPWDPLRVPTHSGDYVENPYCFLCSVKLRHPAGADPDDADVARHMKMGRRAIRDRALPLRIWCGGRASVAHAARHMKHGVRSATTVTHNMRNGDTNFMKLHWPRDI